MLLFLEQWSKRRLILLNLLSLQSRMHLYHWCTLLFLVEWNQTKGRLFSQHLVLPWVASSKEKTSSRTRVKGRRRRRVIISRNWMLGSTSTWSYASVVVCESWVIFLSLFSLTLLSRLLKFVCPFACFLCRLLSSSFSSLFYLTLHVFHLECHSWFILVSCPLRKEDTGSFTSIPFGLQVKDLGSFKLHLFLRFFLSFSQSKVT